MRHLGTEQTVLFYHSYKIGKEVPAFMKISLCMIVKNEEEVLARCLESVQPLIDELIIVDTGSDDETITIARNYTDLIYQIPWEDDFAKARNFAFSKATGDYIMWLDADDSISPENAKRFHALKNILLQESPDMVMCPYDTAFDGDTPLFTFYRERLVKNGAGLKWQGRVHECIAPHGKVIRSEFRVFHLGSEKERGRRNLHIYQKWAADEPLGPRDQFYYGRELYYHRLYTESISVLEEMLEGKGWYVNKIEACKILSACYFAKGFSEKAKNALFRSFCYGEPRASVCCEIAKRFQQENLYGEAVYWYEAALNCRDHSSEGDFEEPESRGFVPYLELVCCYYALGNTEKAVFYHKKTERLFPNHSAVIFNKQFFIDKGLISP